MNQLQRFLREHETVTRRYFLRLGASGAVLAGFWPLNSSAADSPPGLADAIKELEPYFTHPDEFRDVSRGKPKPHTLPDEKKRQVGLTRDTWSLEVTADPEYTTDIRRPLTREEGTALDFNGLMEISRKHAVRFPKVMTCLNIGCPLGMGIWEGVPLREIFWRTQPRRGIRRVFYYGYHNDDPKQMFRSSMPIDRVLEDPQDLPPIILCYKLNGQWLTSERGGPVRIVVPECYGFKSIKWLSHIVITNLHHANDTYAKANNDVDSWLKTFAATLSVPGKVKAGDPIPITGYAQVGVSGLTGVQVSIVPKDPEEKDPEEEDTTGTSNRPSPEDDPYFTRAPWVDAEILPPPSNWGDCLPENRVPSGTMGFDEQTGRPRTWPLLLAKVHWATLLPGLPEGEYTLRSRTIDRNGHAQPMPRPFRKSGWAGIEEVSITVGG